jgi:peptidylprolyl isomerase
MAPRHVANVKALARAGYFDGLSVNRAQDNYVAQWGDPESDDEAKRRPVRPRDRTAIAQEEERPNSLRAFRTPQRTQAAEFDRAIAPEIPFTALPDGDVYAPEVGWSHSFPVGRDPGEGRTWIAHCYGTLGSARGNEADSGGGTQLYVVIGHAPRHLDRNTTTLGRVVEGIELLSTLPRGSGPLGVYEKPEQRVPIRALRVAADVPAAERVNLEVLRTDTQTFTAIVEARRNRREEWFKRPAGRVELCNVPLPVRAAAAARTDP